MEVDRRRNDNLMKAIIDTNVLIYIFTQKTDVFSQLKELGFKKFLFPKQVITELRNLEKSLNGREKVAAKFALQLIENCKECEVKEIEAEGSDDAIIKLAKEENAVIISNDKELRKKAKKLGIQTGYLRELKFIEVEDF
uniref:Ribonuclease VapC n=1 Tax=Geoglobus ahangari TaxID=113653 RepID=A0A7C4W3W2_9EURY